jgi:hypothetical protein
MKGGSSEPLVRWIFALASVTGVWQLELLAYLERFADAIGASRGSLLHSVLVRGGVPIALALVAQAALVLYDKAIWPVSNNRYKGGWWVYSLVFIRNRDTTNIVGYFHILQSPREAFVKDGHAFYLDQGALRYRGNWESETLVVGDDSISMIFHMRAVTPIPTALPSHYDGYLELHKTNRNSTIAKSCWHGYFHDIGDRTTSGPVYAERMRRKVLRGDIELEEVLKSEAVRLNQRARRNFSWLSPIEGNRSNDDEGRDTPRVV